MGIVLAAGVLITLVAVQGYVVRKRYDRSHDTKPNEMAITRWGFFLPQLKVSEVLCAAGILLMVVGGAGLLLQQLLSSSH